MKGLGLIPTQCQLGLGSRSSGPSTVPVKVKMNSDIRIVQVTGGEDFSCALSTTRQVWCWGANDKGQLGINSTDMEMRCSPILVTRLLPYDIVSIKSGAAGFTLAPLAENFLFASNGEASWCVSFLWSGANGKSHRPRTDVNENKNDSREWKFLFFGSFFNNVARIRCSSLTSSFFIKRFFVIFLLCFIKLDKVTLWLSQWFVLYLVD